MTQVEFAREVGIGQSTVSALLRGDRDLTIDQITRVAKFFGVPAATLLPA